MIKISCCVPTLCDVTKGSVAHLSSVLCVSLNANLILKVEEIIHWGFFMGIDFVLLKNVIFCFYQKGDGQIFYNIIVIIFPFWKQKQLKTTHTFYIEAAFSFLNGFQELCIFYCILSSCYVEAFNIKAGLYTI